MTSTGSIPTLVTGVCSGLTANASYYGGLTSYSISNAPVGTTTSAIFSASIPTSNTCQFNCNSGYVWNGTACLTPAVSGPCTGLPANAVYYGSVTSYTLAGAAVGTSLTASYTGGTLIPNSCMFNCANGYYWNGSNCIAPSAYSSSTTYTSGQAFTWNGATVTVTATGLGTSSTKSTGCDTNDIVIWQGGTNNVQIWAACNVGSTVAGLTSTSYGNYYQWGNGSCPSGYHIPTGGSNTTSTEWGTCYVIMNSSSVFGSCNQTNIYDRSVCTLKLPLSGQVNLSSATIYQ